MTHNEAVEVHDSTLRVYIALSLETVLLALKYCITLFETTSLPIQAIDQSFVEGISVHKDQDSPCYVVGQRGSSSRV